jgi:hypothetical protein
MQFIVHSFLLAAYALSSFEIYKLWRAATGQVANAIATAVAFFVLFFVTQASSSGDPRRAMCFAALYGLKLFAAFALGVQRSSSDLIDALIGFVGIPRIEIVRALMKTCFFAVVDGLVILLALWE